MATSIVDLQPDDEPRPVGFACGLDTAAAGGRAGRRTPEGKGHVLTPGIEPASAAQLPAPWSFSGAVAWVPDERGVAVPVGLRKPEASLLDRLRSGQTKACDLDPTTRLLFAEAGLLTTPARFARACTEWDRTLAHARDSLQARGYALLRDLLPSTLLAALRTYYRELAVQGFLEPVDRQGRRYGARDEPVAGWLHRWIEAVVARAVPEAVRPSYSSLAFCLAGATVERHTDRAQCEYTLSIGLDATPSEKGGSAWPLYLESARDGGLVEVRLAPGDAVLFKGRELPHFRRRLAKGRTSSSLQLHFASAALADSHD